MTYHMNKIIVEGQFSDPFELTAADFMYIGFLIKVSSLETVKFNLESRCKCGHVNLTTLNSKNLAFKDLKAPAYPITGMFRDETYHLDFAPIKVKDVIRLKEGSITYKDQPVDDELALIALHVQNKSFEEAYEFFMKLTPQDEDTAILKEVMSYMDHGLKPVTVQCQSEKCNIEVEHILEGGDELILRPFRKSKLDVSNKIRFGS